MSEKTTFGLLIKNSGLSDNDFIIKAGADQYLIHGTELIKSILSGPSSTLNVQEIEQILTAAHRATPMVQGTAVPFHFEKNKVVFGKATNLHSQTFISLDSNLDRPLKGIPCSSGRVEAECVLFHDTKDISLYGKILVAKTIDQSNTSYNGLEGIILEKGSLLSHASIISRERGIPCIIHVSKATEILKTGMRVLLDGDTGEIQLLRAD